MRTGVYMYRKTLFATLASLALLASAAHADTVQMVRDGFRICASHAGKVYKAKDDLAQAGWESRGISNDLRIFFAPGRAGVGAISAASYNNEACGFGVKDMSVANSTKLAEGIAKAIFGKSMKVAPASEINDPGIKAAWMGMVGGKEAGIAVYKNVNYPNFYRGSMLMMVFRK